MFRKFPGVFGRSGDMVANPDSERNRKTSPDRAGLAIALTA
jgi:hypothetical protein